MRLSARFEEACVLAAQLHADQSRKGTAIPYVAHLLAVSAIVLEHGGNEDQAIAALLHDAIEDQGGARAREEIRRRFGQRVVDIVDGCTDADVIPKPDWRERKAAYLAHLSVAPPPVLLVSAADKIHNARAILEDYRDLHGHLWGRFTGGKEGTLWSYRALVTAFRHRHTSVPKPLVDELDRIVTHIKELAATDDGS